MGDSDEESNRQGDDMLHTGIKVIAKDLIVLKTGTGEYCEIMKGTKLKCVGDEDPKTGYILVAGVDIIAYVHSSKLHEIKRR